MNLWERIKKTFHILRYGQVNYNTNTDEEVIIYNANEAIHKALILLCNNTSTTASINLKAYPNEEEKMFLSKINEVCELIRIKSRCNHAIYVILVEENLKERIYLLAMFDDTNFDPCKLAKLRVYI